ncbi:MAG: ATPase [Chloroflexota bacterium]|nr:MAG: ATPase [Chloroflexota bacterium]
MITIDILYLVDRLEAAVNKGTAVPFSNKRMIDEDECLDIIDQLRIAVPEEIKQSRRVTQEKDRILAQAKEEADRIVQMAKEESTRMADMSEVVKTAQARSQAIMAQADLDAKNTRAGADDYANQVLTELQQRLDELTARVATLQGTVHNGLRMLSDKRGAVGGSTPPAPPAGPVANS